MYKFLMKWYKRCDTALTLDAADRYPRQKDSLVSRIKTVGCSFSSADDIAWAASSVGVFHQPGMYSVRVEECQ